MSETPPEISAPPSDPGASRSAWIAGAIVVAIVRGWAAASSCPPNRRRATGRGRRPGAAAVMVQPSRARERHADLQRRGPGPARPRHRDPRGSVGQSSTRSPRGRADMKAGALIAGLSSARGEADLVEAQENWRAPQREFDNAAELRRARRRHGRSGGRGAGRPGRRAGAGDKREKALEDLAIVAPFDGRIERLSLDSGEYVSAGERSPDRRQSPLTVAIQVPQQALNRIERRPDRPRCASSPASSARARSPSSAPPRRARPGRSSRRSRSKRDGAIPAGISAEVGSRPAGEAHFVATSIVSLGPEGESASRRWTTTTGSRSTRSRSSGPRSRASGSGPSRQGADHHHRPGFRAGGRGGAPERGEAEGPLPAPPRGGSRRGMNALIDAAFSRARAVLITLAMILAVGAIAYVVIPKEANPEVPLPLVYVSTGIDGISPTDAERLLLEPMEAEFGAIEGLEQMSSEAAEGFASVQLEFDGRRRYRRGARQGARGGGPGRGRPAGRRLRPDGDRGEHRAVPDRHRDPVWPRTGAHAERAGRRRAGRASRRCPACSRSTSAARGRSSSRC